MNISINNSISSFLSETEEITNENIFNIPEYVYFDSFTSLNSDLWKTIQKDNDISVSVENEHLKIFTENRQGVNGVNITSTDFRVKSFAMEISFRNPDESALWIIFTVGNKNYANGASFQVQADIYDQYYSFRYKKKDSNLWIEDEENIIDELFGDEATEFHTLKLVYDKTNKIAYGYIDNILISQIDDFSFNIRDRAQIIISSNGRFKDINVDFDDFKSSIPF